MYAQKRNRQKNTSYQHQISIISHSQARSSSSNNSREPTKKKLKYSTTTTTLGLLSTTTTPIAPTSSIRCTIPISTTMPSISSPVMGTYNWMTVQDSDNELLKYDWEIVNGKADDNDNDNDNDNDDDSDPLLLKFASNKVRLGMTDSSNYERDDIDVSQIRNGYYGVGYRGGSSCPNSNNNNNNNNSNDNLHACCNGDEIYQFKMEENYDGTKVRLRIYEYQTCTCGISSGGEGDSGTDGDDDDENSESHVELKNESNYYVAYQCSNDGKSSSLSLSMS